MIKKSYAGVAFIDFEHVSLFNSLFWFYLKFPFFQKKKIEAYPFQMTFLLQWLTHGGDPKMCPNIWRRYEKYVSPTHVLATFKGAKKNQQANKLHREDERMKFIKHKKHKGKT